MKQSLNVRYILAKLCNAEPYLQYFNSYLGQNCVRGSYICEGYAMRVTWKKPRLAEGPVPLRPKPSSSEQSSLCSRYVSRNSY